MAKKKQIPRKASFGVAYSDRISPPPTDAMPKGMAIFLSFEESLKLHLALGQALAHLNGYNRRTNAGKATCVKMTLYPGDNYLTV
jgi:hypothetical protein